MGSLTRIVISLGLAWMLHGWCHAEDWPQYRGPNRDDVSPETGLLAKWPAAGPPLLWTYKDAGVGYSGPAIVGDRLYTLGDRGEKEFLIALDIRNIVDGTVQEAWSVELGAKFDFQGNQWSAGPSSTPTVDGDRIYALSGNGDLVCVTVQGEEVWRLSLPTDLQAQVNPIGGGPKNLGWGFTWSPLVDGERLICTPGGPLGTVAALDKQTGKVIWRSSELKEQAAYTSAMPAVFDGVRQYVVLTNQGLRGIAAEDGALLWQHDHKLGTEVVSSPIIHGSLVHITVGTSNGNDIIKVKRTDEKFVVEEIYSGNNLTNHHGNVVRVGHHVYGSGAKQGFGCQDIETGEILWSDRKIPTGSVTYADGRLYCFSENDGTVHLVEASPTASVVHGRFKVPEASTSRKPNGRIWTPPVVSGGRLFLRDQELIFCYDVSAKENYAAKADEPPAGQRIFSAGHSFHMFVPQLLREMAQAAEIEGHLQVGTQSIGGSRVIQHWDLADDKNRVKPALKSGKIDVLTLSPIYLPDQGIENLVRLAVEHNPDVRVTLQVFWLPYDVYHVDYQKKRPMPVDRNARTVAELKQESAEYFASLQKHATELNQKLDKPVVSLVPVGQAVIALREKIIAGEAPGLKSQEDLFTDAIGHASPPLQALTAYCHYAVIYRRSPVGLPVPTVLKKGKADDAAMESTAALNRLLQELAWQAVIAEPLSGAKE